MRLIQEDIWGIMNIFAEARGEPFEGQVAVGNVVRERMRLKYASDGTVVGTIWKPKQFSWTLGSDPQRVRVLSADDDEAGWVDAAKAWYMSGVQQKVPRGTVLYHADHVQPYWTNRARFEKQIGRHLFYSDPTVNGDTDA
jgi:spore germination cell wall hydrolase CwlJ-like protein